MPYRVLYFAIESLPSVAAFRTVPGLLLAKEETGFWLAGEESMPVAWENLPAETRYRTDALQPGGKLWQEGRCTPTAKIPAVQWQPIAEAIVPEGSPAAYLAPNLFPIPWSLEKPSELQFPPKPILLLTKTRELWKWTETAPKVRQTPLRFTSCTDTDCVVLGEPLPALAGTAFYQAGRLFLPLGFVLPPALTPDLAAESLGIVPNGRHAELGILRPTGNCLRIRESWLVPLNFPALSLALAHTQEQGGSETVFPS